jgi:tetratricopeptide (TPR) repeat protein
LTESSKSPTGSRAQRWHDQARRALQSGDLNAAEKACAALLGIDPNHADAWYIAAVCALEKNRLLDALPRFGHATRLEQRRPDYWAQHARCLQALGRSAEALDCVARASALPDADAATRDTLGNVLTRIGRHTEAAREFEAASRLAPEEAQFHYHLATTLMFCGELAGAAAAYERVLDLDPDHSRAHFALADMLHGPPPDGRIERLQEALERAAGDVDQELVIGHALARTLEAAGRTEPAFALWERTKSAKKAVVGYTIESDRAIFSAVAGAFTADRLNSAVPGHVSPAPIFIVGMPRSGTTLLERILSSHSGITSGGEMTHMARAIKEAGRSRTADLIDPGSLETALACDPGRIGARYLELSQVTVGNASRFVDKMPLNFFLAGFIRRSLPRAKIVCLRRGALDTCLANFRQLFAVDFPNYRYALSLMDTAEYYALFEGLLAHWDAVMPHAIYPLRYENLVAAPEQEIRRLLDFLDIEFEPGMLEFQRNATPVATASATQVRRPIYSGSVGAWRRYESQLEPLRRRLEELGVDPD